MIQERRAASSVQLNPSDRKSGSSPPSRVAPILGRTRDISDSWLLLQERPKVQRRYEILLFRSCLLGSCARYICIISGRARVMRVEEVSRAMSIAWASVQGSRDTSSAKRNHRHIQPIWPLRTVMRRRKYFPLAYHLENLKVMLSTVGEGMWDRSPGPPNHVCGKAVLTTPRRTVQYDP